MLRTKRVTQCLAALALISSSAVMAADSGWYVGASLGQSSVDFDDGDLKSSLEAVGATGVVASVDNTDTGWKLFGGYQLNKNFGFEAAYVNLGTLSSNATYATPAGSPVHSDADGDGFQFVVVGSLPVSESFSFFGKVGAFIWNVDSTVSTSLVTVDDSADGTDLTFGLGANWQFNESIGLRAEWERFQNIGEDESDVDLMSIGLAFHF